MYYSASGIPILDFVDTDVSGDPLSTTNANLGPLAAKIMGSMLALSALLLVGVLMVIVEWRGAFAMAVAPKVTERDTPNKGANLVFVGGLVVVLEVAWMVSSTAGAETDPTPTPSSSETATAPAAEPTAPTSDPTSTP